MYRIFVAVCLMAILSSVNVSAQQQLTREQILGMSIEELSDLPLEDLMQAVETLGVSSVDELFALIMNKNVSSASKKEENSFTSPLSSTVITRDEMRTYGITTIEEAFRLIPGMIVTEKTNGVYDIQMRGLNNIPDNNMFLYTENSNTLMMIDGRPVHNIAMGAVNFDMLSIGIEDIERIEVVRGACGALYGANAVTGVINIITEHPNQNSNLVSGNIQMGSQNTYIGEIAFRKAFNDKIAAGLTYNMQRRERPTDKLWLIPASGTYMVTDYDYMPTPGSLQKSPYYYISVGQDGTITPRETYDAEGLAAAQQVFASMTSVSDGGWFSVEDMQKMKQIYPVSYNDDGTLATYRLFDSNEPEALMSDMFPHPERSRNTIGFNGYINFTPSDDVRFYLSGGYQNSFIMSTPVGDDIFSLNGRTSKTSYVALDANIFDLHLMANYMTGPQDYAYGVSGFKVHPQYFNASAEYDINLDFGLSIRPGLFYQWVFTEDYTPVWDDAENYKWHYEDPGYRYASDDYDHLSGFFNYTCKMTTIAPALRLDYKVGDLRLIGAFRSDKTNIPDKWNHSWQFGASYSINDNNFVRLVYGRANRGTNMVNTAANYSWTRTNMVYPNKLRFSSNEDADLVKIDNIEVGYRWKPSKNVLVDFEAFYSMSDNYGSLMAESGSLDVRMETLVSTLAYMKNTADTYIERLGGIEATRAVLEANPAMFTNVLSRMISGGTLDVASMLSPYASIKYNTLPYDVKQMGISVNVDYIISSKLIAKLNANIQKTTIDNYYKYSQSSDILKMLTTAQTLATSDIATAFVGIMNDYVANYEEANAIHTSGDKYFGPYYNPDKYAVELGHTVVEDHSSETEDGFEHKATPSLYGMLGLIYKPVQQLEVSAFANFIGKRTYTTKYGSDELGNRCTVNMKLGYKPVDKLEVFFNAHNLLNTKKREFSNCDEIGGIYTVGVNFGF